MVARGHGCWCVEKEGGRGHEIPPGTCEVGQRGRSTSVLLCAAATWLHSAVGEGVFSCHCKNRGRVPSSKENAFPNVARQFSAVLLCMNGGSVASERVKGIRLTDSK